VQLLECLFELFGSVADSRDTAPDVLVAWNKFLNKSLAYHETVRTGDRLEWALRSEVDAIDGVLWRIVHAAFELLTGPQAARIRRCAGVRCDWLFVDTSKRGNRRWCDMSVCGNQAKARRFYQRKKLRQTNKANS
jgi:predicted RNA-binding Zn ribbon-like protein